MTGIAACMAEDWTMNKRCPVKLILILAGQQE
jgi:hypothetical protein